MSENYEYFKSADLSGYQGEWVVICDRKLASHGKDLKVAFEDAMKKHPCAIPFVALVPKNDETWIL